MRTSNSLSSFPVEVQEILHQAIEGFRLLHTYHVGRAFDDLQLCLGNFSGKLLCQGNLSG